jgi:hypothetical protein
MTTIETGARRTVVVFSCDAFNTSEERPYFLNPGCYGDDVAAALIAALRTQGIATDDAPDQEDFGWYFDFDVSEPHSFVIGYRPASGAQPGVWIGSVERARGFVGSLLGRRRHGVRAEALRAVHEAVSALPQVSAIAWHAEGESF